VGLCETELCDVIKRDGLLWSKKGKREGARNVIMFVLRFVYFGKYSVFAVYLYFTNLESLHAVAQLVEALHYKLEGRGFDFRWCHCSFSLAQSFRPRYGPGVDSASNRNEYREYFLGLKAAGA